MSRTQQHLEIGRRRWLSLPVSISLGLALAAIIPLVVVLFFTIQQTRPALIDQANKAMQSDAQTRVQLIDTYFTERISDALTLTQVPSLQSFMIDPNPKGSAVYRDAATHAAYSLQAGIFRDKNYTTWSLFDTKGMLLLNQPQDAPAQKHGQQLVPTTELQTVLSGKAFISPVYASADGKQASVDIYAPIMQPNPQNPTQPTNKVIGFMRATLKLDTIWNSVQAEQGNNGRGSYAFILDENGVNIADSDPVRRFKSVGELAPEVQQRISQDARYGNSDPVANSGDNALAAAVSQPDSAITFQAQPQGQAETFQIVRYNTTNPAIHWHYFVLSPVSTVTALADNEARNAGIVTLVLALLIALIGWFAGRGLARPIIRSVENLQGSSLALSTLATSQQGAAEEQIWVVDSSQIGLQSVQYYTDASKTALNQLREVATTLAEHWRQGNARQLEQALERIIKITYYLEDAAEYQNASNQKLGTALKVATQVTEQLHNGATSATEAAAQLELVVKRLQAVLGK